MAQFGDLLAELRQDKKLTQKQLAKIIYVSSGTICNYENNVHYPDVEKLVALADYFDVTVDYLLGRCSANLSPDIFEEDIASGKRVGTFIQEFKELPPERQQALLLIMQDMKISSVLAQYNRRKDSQ